MLTEQIVTFDRLEELAHVLGSVDENLDALERAFDVHMTFREGGIKIMGESEAVALAARALESLMHFAFIPVLGTIYVFIQYSWLSFPSISPISTISGS